MTVTDRDRAIQVRFVAESPDELRAMLPTAARFWRSRVRWFKAFREYAARELLPRLNGFLDCGQARPPVLTAARVRRILKVPFIVEFSRDDGDVHFMLSGGDDDALREHCFEVVGSLTAGITDGEVVSLF